MLKQGSFINQKYGRLLFFGLLSLGACILDELVDGIVGGSQLGETALSAIAIVSPLAVVSGFISELFSGGYAVIYGNLAGAFDKKTAYRSAGEALLISLILGSVSAFALILIKEPFLSAFHCTGELYTCASEYYRWTVVLAAIKPITFTLYYLILIDGDTFVVLVSTIAQIIINIVLSFFLCQKYGVSGLSMASAVCCMSGILIFAGHFFRRTNSIHFTPSWSFQRMAEAFKLSLGLSLRKLFVFSENIIFNLLIIRTCGTSMLPAYVIVNAVLNCFYIAGAVYESGSGFFAVFIGEKNNPAIQSLYQTCKRSLLLIGIAMNVFFILGAGLFPKLYQISTPEVYQASVISSVILAFSAVPFCFMIFFCNLYPALGKPYLGSVLSFLLFFLCPLILAVPLAFAFGYIGISAGIASGSLLALLFFAGIVRKKYGEKGFPLYLKEYQEEIVTFDLRVSLQTIPELRDKIAEAAQAHGVSIPTLGLLIEELYTRILEKNPKKAVLSECSIFFGQDEFRLIVRDSGVIYNYFDENNAVESLSTHVLNSLLIQIGIKHHSLTTSYNRNCFVYKK